MGWSGVDASDSLSQALVQFVGPGGRIRHCIIRMKNTHRDEVICALANLFRIRWHLLKQLPT